MDNVIYCKTIIPAHLSKDGDTPTQIQLTEEVNCYALWECGYDGREILHWWHRYSRDRALEESIALATKRYEAEAPLRESSAKERGLNV